MLTRLIRRSRAAVAFGLSAVVAASFANADDAAARAQQHLAAGEFGAAATAAETAGPDIAGLKAAIAAARTGADYSEQQPATAASGEQQLAGTGADFDTLINLIQNMTTGPWMDTDGEGADKPEPFESGVRVDPQGVLSRVERRDLEGSLAAMGARARNADPNDDVSQASDLRMVSLTRLEKEVSDRLARGERVVESMKHLAGLSEIRYVFIDKDSNDIVIAGPAEGWNYTATGAPVGVTTGRPTLRLEDLVVVLRTFEPTGRQMFGCSIDPREQGLKAVKSFVEESQKRGPLAPGQTRQWAQQIGDTLGHQDITVYGVPANSRVARVIVEADYRMKLIGAGKLEGGKNVPSYFELIAKRPSLAKGSLDALRWWLTLNTEEVLFSEGHDAFEIRGASVKCLSENQFITSSGGRTSTGQAEPINRQFAEQFTQHYAELAASEPVFADLEGVFDLAMAAALIRQERLDERTNWDRGAFATGGAYRTAQYATPKEVDSVVNHRVFNGKDVVVQVAGGVRADVLAAVTDPAVRHESGEVAKVANEAKTESLPAGRWWWDAAR